jgi:hypothetical protein
MSYEEIELELKLRPCNGMTAWRLEGNKHKKPPSDMVWDAGYEA